MKDLVNYFLKRPVVVNALMFGVIITSILIWPKIGKEEYPEFAMDFVRISLRYPGAAAQDVEAFITKPVEEQLKGVSGLDEVKATSSYGSSSISVVFIPTTTNLSEKIQEVKDAVEAVDFPREVEQPVYRQFKSSEKAIIDIGMYLKNQEILDVKSRQELQKYALAFENKLLSLREISGVDVTGYLRPELQVKVKPELLKKYEISMNQVRDQIVSQNLRQPIGSMKDSRETEVTIISELDDIESLGNVTVMAGFQGQRLKLKEIAVIEEGFEKTNRISKVQGHEGIVFNVQKTQATDILSAKDAVANFIKTYKRDNVDLPIDFVLIDDESYDVNNRLSLIASNGVIGFGLIVIILFLFLDFRSGIWVAMGIPFSLAFTLICSLMLGYTINNMTLAAIIIVLGIVVDDAIIIAENLSRHKKDSAHKSVLDVGAPVIASVLTTCAAFVPLYFFSGRFGLFVKYIPTVIFLMLLASIIESFFILPSHMTHTSQIERIYKRLFSGQKLIDARNKFTTKIEAIYYKAIKKILNLRGVVLIAFIALLVSSFFIFKTNLSYVMFPREESRDFRLKVTAQDNLNRKEMAKKVRSIEDIFLNDDRGIVTSVRTSIGENRRGGEVKENEASIRVEIVPPSERDQSLNQLLKDWEIKTKEAKGFSEIKYQKSRWGSDSGSPIAIEIQENNDELRAKLSEKLKTYLAEMPELANVEIEKPITKFEYKLEIDKDETSRLGVSYAQLGSTLRSYIEGDVLYTLNNGDEELDVRFTSNDNSKNDIKKLLALTVSNSNNYLVPIDNLVTLTENQKPANIQRVNFKRATMIYADLAKAVVITPLEIAQIVENKIFPKLLKGSPSANVIFRGEVEDSRESQSDFALSITLVLAIIYLLLIFLFDSFWTPFLIGAIIPFGAVGTILAFWLHGFSQYGFFAVIGTLGMIGVVINDSIVLIDRLQNKLHSTDNLFHNISEISTSRLKAIIITTVTTVAGLFPTAYGIGGYDSMLAEMMLAMGWGLIFGMFITLILVPCIYSYYAQLKFKSQRGQ